MSEITIRMVSQKSKVEVVVDNYYTAMNWIENLLNQEQFGTIITIEVKRD
jgi:hypothetical protein